MYRRSRSRHTLSSRPWAERRNLVYGFSAGLAWRQVGACAPLSPSLGLSQRAETALLNKFVEISATAGRFCSRRHFCSSSFAAASSYHPAPACSRKKSCERKKEKKRMHSAVAGGCGQAPGNRRPGLKRSLVFSPGCFYNELKA